MLIPLLLAGGALGVIAVKRHKHAIAAGVRTHVAAIGDIGRFESAGANPNDLQRKLPGAGIVYVPSGPILGGAGPNSMGNSSDGVPGMVSLAPGKNAFENAAAAVFAAAGATTSVPHTPAPLPTGDTRGSVTVAAPTMAAPSASPSTTAAVPIPPPPPTATPSLTILGPMSTFSSKKLF